MPDTARQPALIPDARRPVMNAEDWAALQGWAKWADIRTALIWAYQDGYRRAMQDSHEAHLALGTPQPPEEER